MAESTLKFSRKNSKEFVRTLNKRVNNYFKENNIPKTGNIQLYIKSAAMLGLMILPYLSILLFEFSAWYKLGLCLVIGVGMAGVGMNIMHDGNHGSYSKKKWLNKLMGGTIYILAGNVYNWQVQHNVLHHTYTNVHGHDEDLDAGKVIRFSKGEKWRKFHRFQHIYSVFLYGLLTLNWAITTDFIQTQRYLKRKLSYGKLPTAFKQWSSVAISKTIYGLFWVVFPIVFTELTWWMVVIGFVTMHYTAGLILSIVFQLAHVIEDTEMPVPDDDGQFEHSWVIHQLYTTNNFSPKNKLINWYTGGLNHQIEHHIFPHISHVHYDKLREIVKQTTSEFNLPYHEYKHMRDAVKSHFSYLKSMGQRPQTELS